MSTARGMKAGLRAVAVALQVASGDALNVTLGVLEAGEHAVSAVSARDRSFARHVADAAKKLDSATREFRRSDVDPDFVESILVDAMSVRGPMQTLVQVLRGRDTFTTAVRFDIDTALPAVDELSDAQSGYLAALCSFVYDTLTSLLEDPSRLPAPLIAVIEAQDRTIDAHALRLDANERSIRELMARLGAPRGSLIIGDRPRLVEHRVKRPEVDQIVERVSSDSSKPVVVSGMRGVGKSQLAASVAERLEADSWDLVAWVNARTREGLVTDLCRVASAYGIDRGDDSRATAAAVIDRLRRPDGERRLLVFDNLERFDDVSDLLPTSGTKIIVTTTRRESPWGPVTEVETFTAPEAVSYLEATNPGMGLTTASAIASTLGRLPLALTQASTTMRRLGLSGAKYLDALHRHPITSTLRRFDGDDYPASVEAALALSIESAVADDIDGSVGRMLRAAAFLSEDGFPAAALLAIGSDELSARAARATLVEQGILRRGEYEETLSMHKLFARVISDRIASPEAPIVVHDVALTVAAILMPGNKLNAPNRARVTDSAVQLASIERMKSALPSIAESPELHQLVIMCASEAVRCRSMEAALMLEPWQISIAASPTSAIEDMLALPASIARTHTQAGDAAHGVTMYEEALENASSAHVAPLTLAELRAALASALRHSGRSRESINLSRETIADLSILVEESEGEDREAAMRLLRGMKNNLAGTLRVSDEPADAISLYDELIAAGLELDDPGLLLKIRSNRLQALKDTGALTAAIEGYQVLLDDLKKTVGEEHADWVIAHGNMSVAIANLGTDNRSLELLTDSVRRHDRVLGRVDRVSIELRVQLAHALQNRGQSEKAVAQLRIAHRRSCEATGSESVTSVGTGFHLACALFEVGNWGEALGVGTSVLRDRREETLSAASTARLRIYLGYAQVNLGNRLRAQPLVERGWKEYAATPSPDTKTLAMARQVLAVIKRGPLPRGLIVGAVSRAGAAVVDQATSPGTAFRRTTK